MTALGRAGFSPVQLGRLQAIDGLDVVEQRDPMSPGDFIDRVGGYDVVAVTRRPLKHLHRSTLARLPRLKALVVHTTGTHWVDTDYLSTRQIPVLGLGGYATDTVAEHTMATLLTFSRRVHLSHDRARGLLGAEVSLRGSELRNRVLGVVGFGRIGRRTAELAAAFGMRIVFHDPAVDGSRPLSEVLARADLIVLAASHRYGQSPVIGASELALTRARFLVNASCDELVDHHAVVAAIRNGDLDGYALDEYDETLARPDIEPGRILQTMHTGWYSDEAMERGKDQWIDRIEQANRLIESARRAA